MFAAVFACFTYHFSLVEPRFTFRLAAADDFLTLFAFLLVALSMGVLAGRVRERERENRQRADETEALLQVSQDFNEAMDAQELAAQLVSRLKALAGVEALVVFDDGPSAADPSARAAILEARRTGGAARDGWQARRLCREGPSCTVAWRGPDDDHAESRDRHCRLLVELAAASMDRLRLLAARAGLEAEARAGRLRDAILSSLSHDLRTPLSAVLASASSLRDYGDRFDAPTRQDLAEAIVGQAERLNRYVERLLDLSRIEAGQVAPAITAVSAGEVVDGAVRRLSPDQAGRVTAKGLEAAPAVRADGRLLEQCLFNLLDNAFVHGGTDVRVTVAVVDEGDWVRLEVRDDGPGVELDLIRRLGEKFQRGGAQTGGSGLGLAVVKGFVSAMDGRAEFEPGPGGRGLTARIILERAAA